MDDRFEYENENNIPQTTYSPINYEIPKTIKKKSSTKGYLISGLIGGLIGAILITVFFFGYISVNKDKLFSSTTANQSYTQNISNINNSATLTKTALLSSSGESFVSQVAKSVGPAVIGIKNKTNVTDWWTEQQYEVTQGEGSGVIISKDGYIITNNHVISGAKSVTVILSGGKEVPAQIVGTDSQSDLAVLKIDPKYVTAVARLGDSSKVQVGDFAIAIGNPLGQEFAGSVTFGVVSAVNRKLDYNNGMQIPLIQTDAAINPGNSGGALVNKDGEVIGINSAKITDTGVEGMGFAIPINYAKPIIDDLIKYKQVQRPTIGIAVDYYVDRMGNPVGLYIVKVYKGTGAEKAGLKENDIITEIDKTKIKTYNDLLNIIVKHKIGDQVSITVLRDGQVKTFKVTLSKPISNNNE
ncbi:S1C family serine protease [Caldicellulosiruptoraceae bacterium PP1]